MAGFIVKADDRRVRRRLYALQDALLDLRPALTNAATELTRRMRLRFSFKRDPDGARWKPWAKSTAEQRKREGRGTLMLYTKATRDQSRFVPGKREIRAVLGTPYAKYHEQPAGAGGRLARRAFMFSQRNGGRSLAKGDEAYLLNALRYQLRKAAAQ